MSGSAPISQEVEEKKQLLYQKTVRWGPLIDKAVVRESTCQLREEDKEPVQDVLSKACSRNGDTGPQVGRSLGQEEGQL